MLANLWKYYFENDLESFRQSLANATFNPPTPSRGGHGGKGNHGGTVGSPGTALAHSPTVTSKIKKSFGAISPGLPPLSSNSKAAAGYNLTRADVNWRDAYGVTLLHSIASCTHETASQFAIALLQAPSLDLYIQDMESGWTALHRALYFGNVTIARALMNKDRHDASHNINISASQITNGLIKIKDREGNSPFDVYGTSIASRCIHPGLASALLPGPMDDDDNDTSRDGDDNDDGSRSLNITPNTPMKGDEIFTFGSNKNFTLGFGDEDDRQYPERVPLKRPEHLLHRLAEEHQSRNSESEGGDPAPLSPAAGVSRALPALIQYQPIIIQDVQLSKLHSAILTTDPEANLYICGFGPGGRIGTGDETTRFHFVCIYGGGLAGKKVANVGLGQNHTLAISSHGEVFTWGTNSFGQLGYALPPSKLHEKEPIQLLPRQVFGSIKREVVIGAAASRVHSVIHTANSLFTFGKNDGQLGLVDSDARSLISQNTPRKVAASLFASAISTVSAIDKATICLLENHEVWVFANYGYTKMSFSMEVSDRFFENSARYQDTQNHICKITAGGDTICAMSIMGDVYTVNVSQKVHTDATTSTSSTTNPSKIRGALSNPQRIWSLRKSHMAVRDVAVGQDGSFIICTNSGSVWRRVKRAKIKDTNALGTAGYKLKDYKFSRVGGLTRITAVRSSTFGAYAAVRRDCDVLKTQIEVDSKSLWKELYSLVPFHALGSEPDDSDTGEPQLRFWIPSQPANDCASIRRVVLTVFNLEERVATLFNDNQVFQHSAYDIRIRTTKSDVIIPVHEFILSGRSEMMRRAFTTFRHSYYFSIPEVMTIEYDSEGKVLVSFPGVDFITLLNIVLYIYTDTLVDVWRHIKRPGELSLRYRQIRLEVMKIASHLEIAGLEQAARAMIEPSKTLHQDMEQAIRQPCYFMTGDVEIELDGTSVKVHSALMCQRCPFFEGLFNGRAGGLWLSSRREKVEEEQEAIKVNLKHVDSAVFQYVLRYLYADIDDDLFQDAVTSDFDAFLDLILDVMFVANELMLDRLQQCCQKMLGHFVNTRNVCQLLNTVAPCSVTEFKDAALEYICLNLEGMLENHLVDELDDDLMLELDEVVRQNQLECLPISKSGRAEAELRQTYPELPGLVERGRKAKLDSITFQSRAREEEQRYGSFSKGKGASVDDSGSAQNGRPRSSRRRSSASKSPLLKARSSAADLMFHMDEGGNPDTKFLEQTTPTSDFRNRQIIEMGQTPSGSPTTDQFWSGSEMRALSTENDIDLAIAISPLPFIDKIKPYRSESISAKSQTPALRETKPWGSTPLSSHKLDMKDIMAQATSNRVSNISSGLSNQAQKAALIAGSLPKISQRARKKQQQQQPPLLAVSGSSLHVNRPPESDDHDHVRAESSKSPWQITLPGPKISLKDILGAESNTSPAPITDVIACSKSPLTLRQTVPGNTINTRGQSSAPSTTNRSVSAVNISQPAEIHPRTSAPSRSLPVAGRTDCTPSSSINPTSIHSICHQSHSVEPSLQLSMADILSQQQTEKELFREAGAKRSLQEIQEEQAFQEWWDEESRKVRDEEAGRKRAVEGERERGRGRGAGTNTGGRGGGRSGGRGRGGIGRDGGEGVRGGKRGGGGGGSRGRGRGRRESAGKSTELANG